MSIAIVAVIAVVVVLLLVLGAVQGRRRARRARAGRHERKAEILRERADQHLSQAEEEEARARKLRPG